MFKKKLAFFCAFFIFCTNLFCAEQDSKVYTLEEALKQAASDISTVKVQKIEKQSFWGKETNPPLAVLDFDSDSKELSEKICQSLISKISALDKFTMVSRDSASLKKIMEEVALQYSGSVEEEQITELGHKLSAKYLVYGSMFEEQGYMKFSVNVSNVETAELIMSKNYSVKIDDSIRNMLGDKKNFVEVQDYVNAMNRRYIQQLNIEKDKTNSIAIKEQDITKKYQVLIDEEKAKERKPYEKPDKFEAKKTENLEALKTKRDKEIEDMKKSETDFYDKKIETIDSEVENYEKKLLGTTFNLDDKDVFVEFGDFYVGRGDEVQYWPFTVKSLNKVLDYTYQGKLEVKSDSVVTENNIGEKYDIVENAKKNKKITGEISYSLANGKNNSEYEIVVKKVIVKFNNEVWINLELEDKAQNKVEVSKFTASASNSSLVLVKGGTFSLGNENGDYDEVPVRQITLKSFYMGKTEVTQEEYTELMGTNPSATKSAKMPVTNVSWEDALKYCNALSEKEGLQKVYTITKVQKRSYYDWDSGYYYETVTTIEMNLDANGYRLPSEAEWEYAAKGGIKDSKKLYSYSGSNDSSEVGWFNTTLHEVMQKKPNALGLYDMSGNVWEWCAGDKADYTNLSAENPKPTDSTGEKVIRGGSYENGDLVSVTYRMRKDETWKLPNLGFRVCRNAE